MKNVKRYIVVGRSFDENGNLFDVTNIVVCHTEQRAKEILVCYATNERTYQWYSDNFLYISNFPLEGYCTNIYVEEIDCEEELE